MLSLQPKIPEIGSEFSTVESLKEAVQQGAKAAGFAFRVNNHKITNETRKRIRSTKCQNYSVTLYTILNENARVWVVQSYKKQHNHELLSPLQVNCLYQYHQLNAEQKELDYIMLKSGAPVQRACHLLSIDGYMRNLFFTHIEAAHHTTICLEVLIVDVTYKTNLYKLILINAIGISDIGNAKSLDTYQIAIAWQKIALYLAYACAKLQTALQKFFDYDEDYDKLLLSVQKVAYAEEIKKAFGKVKKAAMKIQSTQRAEECYGNIKKAIEAASGLDQLVEKISKWAIDQIKRETEENNNTNNSVCKCRLQLNFKLLCHHIIPSTGLISLSIIYQC
ncbi:15352_t:CDS:2 [Gigaspora margarita]|uniref:15352_t:CDS:1 n=1 Tax=Gigaspora margarita TaxID=4874 RepID=A0ABN7URX3_GIGMA|nr:15352_t:CDS:2 [Gigaspora margarita]